MVELGTRCTTERVQVGNSPPTVVRATFLSRHLLVRIWRGAGMGNRPAYSTTLFCHSPVGNAPPGLRRPPASPQPVLRPASGWPALPAAGPRRRAQTGRVAGDGQPALLGLLGGDCCLKQPPSWSGPMNASASV